MNVELKNEKSKQIIKEHNELKKEKDKYVSNESIQLKNEKSKQTPEEHNELRKEKKKTAS